MEKDVKNLIESIIYFRIALGHSAVDETIRELYFFEGKEWCDNILTVMPEDHPSRIAYNKVSNNNFKEVQLTAFAKIAMWQIKEKQSTWEFLNSDDSVEEFVENIMQSDLNNVEKFILENEKILEKSINEYGYYFVILYRYMMLNKNKSKNIDYMIKQIDVIEKSKFKLLTLNQDNEEEEKYRYLLRLYDDLTWELSDVKKYDLAEKYYSRYINYLENYVVNHNTYNVKKYLATAYSNYGFILWEINGGINKKSDELVEKAIELREDLLKDESSDKLDLYYGLACNYANIAFEYKKAYINENKKNENYKNKYYSLFKKAIEYREKFGEIDKSKNIERKIGNLNALGMYYFYIYEDEKARENFNKALEICNKESNVGKKWIDIINQNLSRLK